MAQPYVGEIRMFAGNFAPNGWMFCEGRRSRSPRTTLFNLIGTTYGGDGQETFTLPDLRGGCRFIGHRPRHHPRRDRRRRGGNADGQQIPSHSHPAGGTTTVPLRPTAADRRRPSTQPAALYEFRASTRMNAQAIWPAGGSQPHDEHPALPLHQLHHLAVRGLPAARPEDRRSNSIFPLRRPSCPINSSPKSASSRSTSRRRAGPSATGSSCRSRRTRRSSRCSAPPMAATASRPSPARHAGQCADAARPGPGPVAARPRRDVGSRDASPCSSRRFRSTPTACRQRPRTPPPPIPPAQLPAKGILELRYGGRRDRRLQRPVARQHDLGFQALSLAGGGLPHNNMLPYLTLNFCIALQGVFPPRP